MLLAVSLSLRPKLLHFSLISLSSILAADRMYFLQLVTVTDSFRSVALFTDVVVLALPASIFHIFKLVMTNVTLFALVV